MTGAFPGKVGAGFPSGHAENQKALILDFGGVVTRTLFETHDITERALGLPAGTLTWRGPFDPSTDPLWVSMQAREITERDYWMTRTREVGALIGEDWTDMKTFVQRARGADGDLVLRPQARDAVLKAKAAGLRLAILSNELDLFYGAAFRKRFPLAELGLDRADCVFVDDQKKNIEGAQAVNLPHVHFDVTRPAESYAQALKMLGI